METLSVESVERIVELERRLALARDRLVAEVVFSVEMCREFAERQTRMDAEIVALQRQRGVYWRVRSRAGSVLRRWGIGPRRGSLLRRAVASKKLK